MKSSNWFPAATGSHFLQTRFQKPSVHYLIRTKTSAPRWWDQNKVGRVKKTLIGLRDVLSYSRHNSRLSNIAKTKVSWASLRGSQCFHMGYIIPAAWCDSALGSYEWCNRSWMSKLHAPSLWAWRVPHFSEKPSENYGTCVRANSFRQGVLEDKLVGDVGLKQPFKKP